MKYFTKQYLNFFKTLAANNHKQWFDENRKTYETVVREPFKVFIGDLIQAIGEIEPEISTLEPKNAIFRINRDIRFSKDKTPYKLFNSAIIAVNGRKDKSYPGLYLELNPEKLRILGGVYKPSTLEVKKIRTYMENNEKEFKKIISDSKFVTTFGAIKGNKHKRLPKEFVTAAEKQTLIWNKQWYYETALSPKIILKDDLLETIVKHYKIANDVQNFFIKALFDNSVQF